VATIEEVAKLAGVSTATVSRVLNHHEYVSERTRIRVWEVVKNLGYQPKIFARTLASRKTFTIGIVVSRRIVDILGSEVGSFYKVVLKALYDHREEFRFSTEQLVLEETKPSNSFDGYLIVGSDASCEQVKAFSQSAKVVLVDHYVDGLRVNSVVSDGYGGMFYVTERFIAKGKSRIVHLHGPLTFYGFRDRYAGYVAAMQKNGLLPVRYEYDDLHEEIDGVLKKILQNRKPEVILCSNDIIALRTVRCLKKWGYSIPRDISVVGFDDIAQSEVASLSTLRVQKYEMGYHAAKRLYELLIGHGPYPCKMCLYTSFIRRESSI